MYVDLVICLNVVMGIIVFMGDWISWFEWLWCGGDVLVIVLIDVVLG